jgi:hypothetical protein
MGDVAKAFIGHREMKKVYKTDEEEYAEEEEGDEEGSDE